MQLELQYTVTLYHICHGFLQLRVIAINISELQYGIVTSLKHRWLFFYKNEKVITL